MRELAVIVKDRHWIEVRVVDALRVERPWTPAIERPHQAVFILANQERKVCDEQRAIRSTLDDLEFGDLLLGEAGRMTFALFEGDVDAAITFEERGLIE